jgi:hypothetical protein
MRCGGVLGDEEVTVGGLDPVERDAGLVEVAGPVERGDGIA